MLEKIDYYDTLGVLVPGALLVAWVPACFPNLLKAQYPSYPETFAGVVLVALAVFAGQTVQALASWGEPVLCWTWRGRHSDRAMRGECDRILSRTEVERVKAKIAKQVGIKATEGALFRAAIQLAEADPAGRAAKFNGLYAYHRNLLTLTFLCLAMFAASAFRGGVASTLPPGSAWAVGVFGALLLLLLWNRARQRSIYYVREVLLAAEQILDDRAAKPAVEPASLPEEKGKS